MGRFRNRQRRGSGGASGATPATIGGLAYWFKADAGITIGTGVSTWADQSGKGRNLTQVTGSKQPLVIANARNGKPAIRGDGLTQTMASAGFTMVQPCTICLVWRMVSLGVGGVHDIVYDGVSAIVALLSDNGPATQMFAGAALTDGVASYANGTFAYGTFIYNGASSVDRINGAQKAAGNAGASGPGGLTVFSLNDGTRSTNADIAEIYAFPRVLGAAEINASESYQRKRWAL